MKPLDAITVPLRERHMIEASAGTGKTYTITSLVLRLLVETEIPISAILVVTFTEAATAELKSRIRERLKGALDAISNHDREDPLFARFIDHHPQQAKLRILTALRDFDTAEVSTIHGFLNQMLMAHAFESGVSFDASLVTDNDALLTEVAHEFYANELFKASPLFIEYLDNIGFEPKNLKSLLSTLLAHPDLHIPLNHTETTDPSNALIDAYQKGRALWEAEKSSLCELLMTDKRIKHNPYNKRNVPKWALAIDKYFQTPTATIPTDEDKLFYFSASKVAANRKADNPPIEHPLFDACEQLITCSNAFEQMVLDLKHRFAKLSLKTLAQNKRGRNVFTYDDMLTQMDDALKGPMHASLIAAVRSRFRAVLIDEFQDTDPVQYRIFDRIYSEAHTPLFLIGDPKQSIYGFRGADIHTYLRASNGIKENSHTLDTNWRSSPSLIQAVNTLFEQLPCPFYDSSIHYSPVTPSPHSEDLLQTDPHSAPLEIRFLPAQTDGTKKSGGKTSATRLHTILPDLVAKDILNLISNKPFTNRPVQPSDIAVLVRNNNQARTIQTALKARGIPGVVWGATSVFHSQEALSLATILSAVENPSNLSRLFAALSTPIIGLSAAKIQSLQQKENAGSLDRLLMYVHSWREVQEKQGLIPMLYAVLELKVHENLSVAEKLLTATNGDRIMTNLRHLVELLHNKKESGHLSLSALIEWFARQRSDEHAAKSEDVELRLESDDDAVKIITIHKSKGLEFEVVYCPFLWAGLRSPSKSEEVLFHNPSREHRIELDIGSADFEHHRELAREEAMAEDLRLTYVALTRAKQKCVIVWGLINRSESSPLAYLFHRPKEATKLNDITKHIVKLDEKDLLDDIKKLSNVSRTTIICTQFGNKGEERLTTNQSNVSLHPRQFKGTFPPSARVHSFTSLVSNRHAEESETETPDYDAIDVTISPSLEQQADSQTHPLAELTPGARTGNLLHGIFEEIDFTAPQEESLSRVVCQKLKEFGFEAPEWKNRIVHSVQMTLRAQLDPFDATKRLTNVPINHRVSELEFLFPLDTNNKDTSGLIRSIATVIKSHFDGIPSTYIDQITGIGLGQLSGYMKGFIDLIFEHKEKFYIVDYKSNYLGENLSDYKPAQLVHCMAEHHYILQYLIYTVALNLYLKNRLPNYSYKDNFGGVYYLFLRGIDDNAPPQNGVFFNRPNEKLISVLAKLLIPSEVPCR